MPEDILRKYMLELSPLGRKDMDHPLEAQSRIWDQKEVRMKSYVSTQICLTAGTLAAPIPFQGAVERGALV